MRILITCVGTRGDVQPALGLAVAAREQGHEVRLCAPPNFTDWAAGLGFESRPIGVAMRAPKPGEPPPVIPDLIADQFAVVGAAADNCDLIVGAGAHQYAARSVAEARNIPCVVAVYAPTSLPSPGAEPPWAEQRAAWNRRSLERVNGGRAALGLAPIDDVLTHILGDRPWLAADAALGPAPEGLDVAQTGAWLLRDDSPLPPAVEAFLEGGEPPVYLGLGSMPAAPEVGGVLVEAARAVGRRAILSEGWAGLAAQDAADVLVIGDVNHAALFARVAAVAHHGGAGTTTAAALAGAPQVLTPMYGDQPWWAARVAELGLGATTPSAGLTVEALAAALDLALRPPTRERARAFAGEVTPDGAAKAVARLAAMA